MKPERKRQSRSKTDNCKLNIHMMNDVSGRMTNAFTKV